MVTCAGKIDVLVFCAIYFFDLQAHTRRADGQTDRHD